MVREKSLAATMTADDTRHLKIEVTIYGKQYSAMIDSGA